jgi:formylglycine-generating enzyme required for sulfatase activity
MVLILQQTINKKLLLVLTLVFMTLVTGSSVKVGLAQSQPPVGMVLIPAGSFQMGDAFHEGDVDEGIHTVTLSAYYIDKYEVTKGLWDDVANWAAEHGYDIKAADGTGKAPNYPVESLSWFEAVKWANARSEKEGLTPAYYTDESQSVVFRTGGSAYMKSSFVNWNANGYRLPTEAEWENAARGGCSGHRYPWCDTDSIDHTRANYGGNATVPVGSFPANGYGLYDTAGNAGEWVWDVLTANPGTPQTDPHGKGPIPTWVWRVQRGGTSSSDPYHCRVSYKQDINPFSDSVGFRIAATAH